MLGHTARVGEQPWLVRVGGRERRVPGIGRGGQESPGVEGRGLDPVARVEVDARGGEVDSAISGEGVG